MQHSKQRPIIEIIIGSTRPVRVGYQIADWVYAQSSRYPDVQFQVTDLAEWDLPLLNEPVPARDRQYQHAHTKKWGIHIAKADGYIIITPEYNAGYPAALKNAIDYLYHEWINKPVALVGYGWNGGRGAIGQLEQVFNKIGMQVLDQRLHIAFAPHIFNDQLQIADPNTTLLPYTDDLTKIMQELLIAVTKKDSNSSKGGQGAVSHV